MLKNAIDPVYAEWAGKPAMIVSYGGHGGGRAAEQLDQVLRFVKALPVATKPALALPREQIEANAGEIEPASVFAAHVSQIEPAFVEFAAALQAP